MDVLDEVLAGCEADDRVPPPRMGTGFATPSIFRFESLHIGRNAGAPAWLAASVPPPPLPPVTARPRRTLSPRQREALNAFVQLGASISDDFTDHELRSTFRLLALRYHPDRHPGSSDRERAHLSLRFSRVHDAYESLKSVPVCSN